MTTVLVTGMSGTGKSTVIGILRDRGYLVAETDERGWCVPENNDWASPDSEWIWDAPKITALLDQQEGSHLFIDGCRSNQGKFYKRFDEVVVLTAPLKTILQRVSNRSNNPFGSTEAQRNQIAKDKREVEPLLISGASKVIDTSQISPEQIANQLEALL